MRKRAGIVAVVSLLASAGLTLALVAFPTSGGNKPDNDPANEAQLPTADAESGFEWDGLRVSIQSLKRIDGEVHLVYRIQMTTRPRRWSTHRNPIPVNFVFWDGRKRVIETDLKAQVYFSEAFERGKTDRNDALLKVVPPAEARLVSIQMGGDYVTKRIAIP
jgi:hypothetical protein